MKNLILMLFFCFTIISCQHKQHEVNKVLSYNKVKLIEVDLDNEDQYNHSQLQLIDSCTIIALDRNFQKLDIFSLCESKFVKSILFSEDGPNRVYPVSSFYLHSADSIFLFSLDASTFQLISSSATVLGEWRMSDNLFPTEISDTIDAGTDYFYPFSLTQNGLFNLPFSYDDSKKSLIFNIMAQSDFAGLQKLKTLYSAPILCNYSLINRSFVGFEGKWPEMYSHDKTPNNPFNSIVFNDEANHSLINFNNSHQVYSTRDNQFYQFASNYFEEAYTLFSIAQGAEYTTEQELDAYHQDEGYANLIYDPFKGLYYRIAKHYLESGHRMEARWSIIVFNEKFKVLGEVLMPKVVYNYLQILPTADGLLISKENPYSLTNKEDIYEFDLIEINL